MKPKLTVSDDHINKQIRVNNEDPILQDIHKRYEENMVVIMHNHLNGTKNPEAVALERRLEIACQKRQRELRVYIEDPGSQIGYMDRNGKQKNNRK